DRALVNESIVDFQRALSLAPMRADTWMRYAYALYMRDGYSEDADRAMLMSHTVGPAEGQLLNFRLRFGLANWEAATPELRAASLYQAQLMWRYWGDRRRQLIDLYLQLDTPEKLDAVRRAVGDEIEAHGGEADAFIDAVRRRRAVLQVG
ncbi:MAG: hypothetical protein AAGL49_02735, partial [Pseudomonadota bacterium]